MNKICIYFYKKKEEDIFGFGTSSIQYILKNETNHVVSRINFRLYDFVVWSHILVWT